MERRITRPEQKSYQYGYELALKMASQKLTDIADLPEQCRRAGARLELVGGKKLISLKYLNQTYKITLPEIDVLFVDSQQPVPPRDKLLILHYLTQAQGSPISTKKITYKELPEGTSYFPTFYKRAIKPLVDNFGKEPHRLLDAGARLGGHRADYGDVAVTINAFTKVPLTLVLWQGDDELTPEGSVLFDSSISDYLTTEDITVLCETVAWRLVRIFRG